MEPKKGLKLVGLSGLGARVTNVTKNKITVEVERRVKTRAGEEKIEVRVREIDPANWHFFVLGYECASS